MSSNRRKDRIGVRVKKRRKGDSEIMKKLMSSTAAKIISYILLVISGIFSVVSGIGIYSALVLRFYSMKYYPQNSMETFDTEMEIFYENLRIMIFNFRYELIAICVLAVIVLVSCFSFLICAAGHRKNSEELYVGVLTKIPLDIFFVLWFMAGSISIAMADSFMNIGEVIYLLLVSLPVCLVLLTSLLADLKVRVKLGKWWQNTVVYLVLHFVYKIGKKFWNFNEEVFLSLPLIWKSAIIVLGVWCIELFLFLIFYYEQEAYLIVWFLEKAALLPVILYGVLMLRKLQRSGEELAAGNLSYHTETSKMFWDFKAHGENLNNIALGMSKAVEERLKSERLKTELITNVSHDIKTPLTSIINYSDLISKESCENEKIKEYSIALHRQSERLKKLITDLMDASKVSTGNIEVLLAPCEADIFLTQTVGEYEEKLKEHELNLITKIPQESLKIMVDGRHMWRIFDNLMNNVFKYAQSGTRVYLTLEERNNRAVFSLKNISHYPLDISSEELMERFVRGDKSRHTEGSGLGLSIAKSLTELQNGEFDLTVDGDFFKVVISFLVV